MNLNSIKLPDFIVSEWYKDALVIPPPADASPTACKFLGSNRRHITVLVHAPGAPFLPDDQLAFLTRILEACRMTLADVAIVNNAAIPVTIAEVRQQSGCRSISRCSNPSTTTAAPTSPHPASTNWYPTPKKAS